MGTGLLSPATWATHTILQVSSGAPKGGASADSWIGLFPQRGVNAPGIPGSVNFFDPLEGRILYFMVEVFSNTDVLGFEVELRRNAVSTTANISFGPSETGRKALLLNIPYLQGEFLQYRIIKPQNFSIIFFQCFFAGKLTGASQ